MFALLLPARGLFARIALVLAALLVATIATPVLSAPAAAAVVTGKELLPNHDFSAGATGWRTNDATQKLTVLAGANRWAQLTSTRTTNVTLNDSPNTVKSVPAGTTFTATARIRTTTPVVSGELRVREVAGSAVTTHKVSFRQDSSAERTVTLRFTTTRAGAHLDVNLAVRDLPVGRNLLVDWVSLKAEAPSTPSAPAPAPVDKCNGVPPAGTQIGMSAWMQNKSVAQTISDNDRTFGRLAVLRHFSSGLPFAWNSTTANLMKDRTLVLSFKVHPSKITDGSHDAFFRNWFATAPTNQTIYWSYFHEPENNINKGEFTTAQYRAAWTRLAGLARESCKPNLFATLILTEWTMNPASKRDYTVYDAGKQHIEVIAFDPYNGVWDPQRTYYQAPSDLLGSIAAKMKADGRPWGIAEIGSRISVGDNGTGRAQWLTSIAQYARANNASFVTYFNTIGNGDWRLLDSTSQRAWAAEVAR